MNDTPVGKHNPDVLSCLANLSSDEVFTPPQIVKQMLDMLPAELFSDKTATFLDPACKSGVFLREIARRLIEGLKDEIPNLQQRVDHIFKNQLYGIAITEMTSLLSRRSLYCSMSAKSKYSVTSFDNSDGNVRYDTIEHDWRGGRCVFCGASQTEYDRSPDLESHAYEFIHIENPQEIFNMKFDVIIGNPPYQLSTSGADNGAQAKPIYHLFVQQAIKLQPRYVSMIIPSRWFAGGWGLDDFRANILNCNQISVLHDFLDSYECFPTLGRQTIKGGICYFLWDRDYRGDTRFVTHDSGIIVADVFRKLKERNSDILIRYSQAIPILNKVKLLEENTFDSLVSTKKPFGLTTNFHGKKNKFSGAVSVFAHRRMEYVSRKEITRNSDAVDKHKLIVPKAVGTGDGRKDEIKPVYCAPNFVCTETYLLVGPFGSKRECDNVASYIETKFFHFLVTLLKNTQDCMRKVYSFVPIQDFSETWTDEKLYKKYDLTQDEIAFIESMIRPMDSGGGGDE